MQGRKSRSWWTPELLLVIVMLAVLTILVCAVLWAKIEPPPTDVSKPAAFVEMLQYRQTHLDYRKDILALIITAFGAWVGAGAAYFFGRESLREASDSLLKMREPSPQERLRQTRIRDISPRLLDWKLKANDNLTTVTEKLKAEPDHWFLPVVKDDGTLDTVLHEEAIWRYIESQFATGASHADTLHELVSDVVTYVTNTQPLRRLVDIYVAVTLDKSAGDAHELMQNKEVYLAIVMDDTGKPTHYLTTGDLRHVLLQGG